jgi:nuclear pore complex protein Nup54
VRRKHRELCVALLRVMRRVDLLEGRFAAANGYWAGGQARRAAADLARQLAALETRLAPGSSGRDFLPSAPTA